MEKKENPVDETESIRPEEAAEIAAPAESATANVTAQEELPVVPAETSGVPALKKVKVPVELISSYYRAVGYEFHPDGLQGARFQAGLLGQTVGIKLFQGQCSLVISLGDDGRYGFTCTAMDECNCFEEGTLESVRVSSLEPDAKTRAAYDSIKSLFPDSGDGKSQYIELEVVNEAASAADNA